MANTDKCQRQPHTIFDTDRAKSRLCPDSPDLDKTRTKGHAAATRDNLGHSIHRSGSLLIRSVPQSPSLEQFRQSESTNLVDRSPPLVAAKIARSRLAPVCATSHTSIADSSPLIIDAYSGSSILAPGDTALFGSDDARTFQCGTVKVLTSFSKASNASVCSVLNDFFRSR